MPWEGESRKQPTAVRRRIRCAGRRSHYGIQLFTGTFFVFYSPSCTIPGRSQDISRKEKAPSTFQSRTPRQPSPRTAKPRLNLKIQLIFCKRHFGNPTPGWMRADAYEENETLDHQSEEDSLLRGFSLLLLPGQPVIARDPNFRSGGGHFAMLRVREIQHYNITGQNSPVGGR